MWQPSISSRVSVRGGDPHYAFLNEPSSTVHEEAWMTSLAAGQDLLFEVRQKASPTTGGPQVRSANL